MLRLRLEMVVLGDDGFHLASNVQVLIVASSVAECGEVEYVSVSVATLV